MSIKDLALHLHFIHEEIRIIESRIEPVDCGYLKTAVGVLKSRAQEIKKQIEDFNE
jgi:hypothetical protein